MDRGPRILIRVFRCDPGIDSEARYTDHPLAYDEHTTLLDALEHVNEHAEPLAFQRECRMFKCGSCAVNVNGRPYLACKTKLHEAFRAEDVLVIEPLTRFPLIRDLLVNFSLDLPARARLRPFPEAACADCATAAPVAAECEVLAGYTACIRCAACDEACARAGKTEGLRPMDLMDLARLASDPRDKADRALEALSEGLRGCNGCRECNRVCPVGLEVFELAVGRLRQMMEARGLR